MKQFSYFALAKEYGIRSILINWDSILASILTLVVCIFYLPWEHFSSSVTGIILTLVGANAGLLGIVLAGYVIMISMMQGTFVKFLKDTKILNDIVFLFTHSSILIGIGLVSSILLALFLPVNLLFAKILFVFSIEFTIYGIFSIILLLLYMKRPALLRGEFSDIEKKYSPN